jgi:hypothetical protein
MRKLLILATVATGLLLGLAPVASAGPITDVVIGHNINKAKEHHDSNQHLQQQPAPPATRH